MLNSTSKTKQVSTIKFATIIVLSIIILIASSCSTTERTKAQETKTEASFDDVPRTFQDPAVPLIALPATFASRRAKSQVSLSDDGFAEIVNIKGPGCIRHIWFHAGDWKLSHSDNDKMINTLILEINVDGAEKPQVVAPLKSFFGIMQEREPYFVNNSAYTVLPNPVAAAKDRHIPGTPGYNLYLPIPFRKSCSIRVRGQKKMNLGTVIDWHKYEENTALTPYRLHAAHKRYKTTTKRGTSINMAKVSGRGFLAGFVTGYIQKNKSDMVFHTGGINILLDEKTDPYTIHGKNVEDDYGFTWGFNNYQTRWIGCPTHENRGRKDQDGVFYRFFGPDPIAFRSSFSFRAGCRGDDMETVVYYYKMSGSGAPEK